MSLAEVVDADGEQDGGKYLTFTLGDVCYGLDVGSVTEIIGLQTITPIPDVPECIRGVINRRGKAIPVMDVRARFQLETREYHDHTCIIVIEIGGASVGLVVDAVDEVLSVADEDIESPPSVGSGNDSRCVSGLVKVGEHVKLLLDVGMLIEVEGRRHPAEVRVTEAQT